MKVKKGVEAYSDPEELFNPIAIRLELEIKYMSISIPNLFPNSLTSP